MNPLIQLKKSTPQFLIPLSLLLICFALMPTAQAVGPDTEGSIAGSNNGEGIGVLVSRTTGVWNTGTGFEALNHDTVGKLNTATGLRALFSNTSGSNNTATGVYALYGNTTGWYNNAVGAYALANNTEGNYNTANGYGALFSNTTGTINTANGYGALYRNTTSNANTANGAFALFSNTTGSGNTAIGNNALASNTTGFDNIALGGSAGLGLTTENSNIIIGHQGIAGESSTIRIGSGSQTRTFIAAIRGVPTGSPNTLPVLIDLFGQLGTASSSRRFKKEIKPMDQTSEALLALNPVTFHYKSDSTGTPQFGLIAEEVAQVNPDLVVRDADGEIYAVRYEAINAMLLNEFIKEHRKVEQQEMAITELRSNAAKQEATIALQQQEIKALTVSLKEQSAQIQKVSAELEVSKLATKVVVNNP